MATDPPGGFHRVVAQVHDRAASGEPAALLDAAATVSAEHAADADRLLDHFVAHARGTGMSWTDIGARLGVHADAIRAASHRLFSPPSDAAGSQTPALSREATCALDAAAHNAAANATSDEPPEVRTEHLLAVLALDPGSRARRVLNELGVDI